MDIIEIVIQGRAAYQAEMAQLPVAVLAWMWAMRAVFVGGGVLFIGTRLGRAVLAVMIVHALSLFALKGAFSEIPASLIGASLHLALWLPLLVWLFFTLRRRAPVSTFYSTAARWWGAVVACMLAISLALDAKEVMSALAGA